VPASFAANWPDGVTVEAASAAPFAGATAFSAAAPATRGRRGFDAARSGGGLGRSNVNWDRRHIGRVAALLAIGPLEIPIAATYALADAPAALGSFGVAHKRGKVAITVR
jgi:NADPH:quinone reductase-like Zn-dependent oxidoreductase